MKKKILSILGAGLALVMVLSLVVALAPANQVQEVQASPDAGAWSKFPTPRPGALSKYLLVGTSAAGASEYRAGPGPIAKAIDGTLYCYWDVQETDDLYKSADNGRTWSRCSTATDELGGTSGSFGTAIIDIACSPDDADLLYVADNTTVYKSTDAGGTFTTVAALPSPVGTACPISNLDAGFDGTAHWIVVGTANASGGEVYIK